jgi:hypothetical protein
MFKKRWFQRDKLSAVHDNDLEEFLSSIGVLNQIVDGHYNCIICNINITLENLGAIYPKDNKINFICDRLSCLDQIDLIRED